MRRVHTRQVAAAEAAALGLALFAVYAAGACRTIYVGDSGELVAAVHTLGVPHPTGYPLYVLVGKLWTLLVPVGSIAYRMSLFSAACAAAAAAGLYGVVRAAGLSRLAALVAALLLAFSPSFWAEANVQRVYALNALFVVAALAAAFAWKRSGLGRYLVLAFFLCGLGATNHMFMGVFALALGLWAPWSDRRLLRRGRTLGSAAGALALGLLPYLYLFLRSRQQPRLDWGNPETLGSLLTVVLRLDFWQRAWIEKPADLLPALADYLGSFGEELLWVGVLLGIVGLVAGKTRRVPIALLWLIVALNFVAVALHGSRSDLFLWHRYYVPSYSVAALLAGLGAAAVERWVEERSRSECRPARPALRWGWRLTALALPAVLLFHGYPRFDRSRYRIAEDFSRRLLAELPPGSHLAASDDNILFVLIYLHLVEGLRPDVDLILQGVGGADLPPLRFDPQEEPLYFTHHPNWDFPPLDIVPAGLSFRVMRAGAALPPPRITEARLDGEEDPRVPKDYLTDNLLGHFHYMLGLTHEAEGDWPAAVREFGVAAEASPENDVLFYNLGLIYARAGLYDRAIAAFAGSHRINPRHIASQSRAQATDRIAELEAEVQRIRGIEERLSTRAGLTESSSGAYHRALAELLDRAGERLAARGHLLLAVEAEDRSPS